MSETESLMSLQRLNGDNYRNWAFRVKNSLKYKKLWKCVVKTGTDAEEDDQALSIISLGCNDIVKDLIIDCTSAKEAWEALEEKFVRKTPAAKVALYCALTSLQCHDLAGIRDLLDEFGVIVRKLQELSVEMDSDMYSIMLLRALPASFEQFKVALMTRDELPTMEEIKMKVEEERLRQMQTQPAAAPPASETMQVALSISKDAVKCFKCHQRGHYARECKNSRGYRRPNEYRSRDHDDSGSARGRQKFALFASVLAASRSLPSTRSTNKWIIDSGCTMHVCRDRSQFVSLRPQVEEVTLPNLSKMTAQGIGTVVLQTPYHILELHDVRFIPESFSNFFSVPTADLKGCRTTLGGGKATLACGQIKIAEGPLDENRNYVMEVVEGGRNAMGTCGNINSARKSSSLFDWHRRLGHLNMDSIVKMSERGLVEGLELKSTERRVCEVCARSKISKEPYPRQASNRANERIHRIHSDVCEMPVQSYGGSKYFVTFIDDFSRYTRVYSIARKSDVIDCWLKYKALMENQCGTTIKILRSDNGREYVNREFEAELSSSGIVHETSVPESPAQNGVAERMNRSLTEMVRCMLLDGEMPDAAWAEALQTATYIRNRSESAATSSTPFEILYGRKPTMGHIRRFGAKVVALKRDRHMQKLQPKGDVMRFCGYAPSQKGYRMLCTRGGTVTVSRNCRFLDDEDNVVHVPTGVSSHGQPAEQEEAEVFVDCEAGKLEEPGTSEPRQQPGRAAKVPRNYKDVSSEDEDW